MEKVDIVRPWIGITAVDRNPQIVEYYKIPVEHGVLVTGVIVNSQAALARIQSGDPITRVGGGLEINNVRDVVKVINLYNVGDVVDVEYIRENQRLAGQMTLEKAPSAQPPESMR